MSLPRLVWELTTSLPGEKHHLGALLTLMKEEHRVKGGRRGNARQVRHSGCKAWIRYPVSLSFVLPHSFLWDYLSLYRGICTI